MSLPIYLHSGMAGAPSVQQLNGHMNALLNACLVNGFNTQSVSSATCASGVVTFNFGSAPGFNANDTVTIAGASNSTVNGQFRVQSAASNQVLVAIPGVPDGAVGSTITLKFSPLGWTRPYSGTGIGVYRQGGGAAHKRFVRIYDNTATTESYFYARGYENMTAVSTGTGPFPTTAQQAGNGSSINFGAVAPPALMSWQVIGTPRFFYVATNWGADMTGTLSTFPAGQMMTYCFGELANVYKATDVYAYLSSTHPSGLPSGFSMPRAYTGTGTALAGSLYGEAANATCLGVPGPDAGSGHILFSNPAKIYDSTGLGSIRGTVPGLLCMAHSVLSNAYYPGGHQLSGVPGVTGRLLLTQPYASGSMGEFALLMDEDWGDT